MTDIVEVLVPESPQIIEVQVPGLQGPEGPEGPEGPAGSGGGGGAGITDGDKGDITVTGTGAIWTVDLDTISNTKLANMDPGTLKGNDTGVVADPKDIAAAQVSVMLNSTIAPSWLNVTATPTTLFGYGITDAASLVHGHAAEDITSGTLGVARLPAFTGGDVTAVAGSVNLQIASNVVTNIELADMAANTVKGNNTGGGDPADLTASDLATMLSGIIAPVTHTHVWADITGEPTTLAGYGITDAIPISQKGAANGVVPLNASTKIDTSYLPSTSVSDVSVVASQAAQLALLADEGDVAVRTDISKTYIHNGGTAGTMADWTEMLTPTGVTVTSVAGKVGDVTLDAADIVSGTFIPARMPAYIGDVVSPVSSNINTIAAGAVTNPKLADMPANTIKGNNTVSSNDPADLTQAQIAIMLGGLVVPASHNHVATEITSGTLPSARMPALTGDVITPVNTVTTTITNDAVTNLKLADMPGNTIKGNSSGLAADPADLTPSSVATMLGGLVVPATHTHAASAITSGTLNTSVMPAHINGDVTSPAGSTLLTIIPDAVTNPKLANMATGTIKGRATLSPGDPEDLTGTQATTLLDVFTSALKGLVPASGGGTVNFLRADGTFATPPGAPGGAVLAYPAGHTVDAVADQGDALTNEGATGMSPFVLPPAAAGLEHTFIVQDSDGLSVVPAVGDTINLAGTVFSGIQSVATGSSVTLKAINTVEWVATALLGTWSTYVVYTGFGLQYFPQRYFPPRYFAKRYFG